ncbi:MULTISPECIES: metal ABC transporter ATP-binding protein [Nitrincola]|jgi:zinc transport system ATP-binding protein|uniref:Metal ABC transporter ATP-binding protein n=1 Tax=Nitrincola iocasae TaxID=2614693 RepID=A0A5J6LE04_9GAMM|nr:metal ABC transporter ATP-binding protein [Nitrincola iocasae]QEW06546.1 metal ABC transporter ATP-binding protein [Nitrincola iocasae]
MKIKGPAVELINLSLQLNRVILLEPLSAHFKPGRMHAITGPNGAGKSSLIKCLLGLMPHSGQIRRHWPGRPGNIAYVPQQTAFEPSLPVTIEEFMLTSVTRWPMFFKRKVAEQQRISRLLQRVGLENKQHLRLGQLSGGERQRLLFAQALERDSHLWCIDEPMTGLDQSGQSLMTAEMIRLRDQGATLFVVHHDMDWIKRHADELWVIEDGLKHHELLCQPSRLQAVESADIEEVFA